MMAAISQLFVAFYTIVDYRDNRHLGNSTIVRFTIAIYRDNRQYRAPLCQTSRILRELPYLSPNLPPPGTKLPGRWNLPYFSYRTCQSPVTTHLSGYLTYLVRPHLIPDEAIRLGRQLVSEKADLYNS